MHALQPCQINEDLPQGDCQHWAEARRTQTHHGVLGNAMGAPWKRESRPAQSIQLLQRAYLLAAIQVIEHIA